MSEQNNLECLSYADSLAPEPVSLVLVVLGLFMILQLRFTLIARLKQEAFVADHTLAISLPINVLQLPSTGLANFFFWGSLTSGHLIAVEAQDKSETQTRCVI